MQHNWSRTNSVEPLSRVSANKLERHRESPIHSGSILRDFIATVAALVMAIALSGCSLRSDREAEQAEAAAGRAQESAARAEQAAAKALEASQKAAAASEHAAKSVEDATREINAVADRIEKMHRRPARKARARKASATHAALKATPAPSPGATR
jgi:hypothetical protein